MISTAPSSKTNKMQGSQAKRRKLNGADKTNRKMKENENSRLLLNTANLEVKLKAAPGKLSANQTVLKRKLNPKIRTSYTESGGEEESQGNCTTAEETSESAPMEVYVCIKEIPDEHQAKSTMESSESLSTFSNIDIDTVDVVSLDRPPASTFSKNMLNLSTVVWVNRQENSEIWWPAEIISKDNTEKPLQVRRFGNITPEILELYEVDSNHILPFNHKLSATFRAEGRNSGFKNFNAALELALERDAAENDDLPDVEWAIQKAPVTPKRPTRPKLSKQTKNNRGEKAAIESYETNDSDEASSEEGGITSPIKSIVGDFSDRDESLKIPGELVFAGSNHNRRTIYWPARIESFVEPNKYKVQYCDDSHKTLLRNQFFTPIQKEFQTCELGDWEPEQEDLDYDNPEIRERIQSILAILERVAMGKEKSSWRYTHFIQGGKQRNRLAENVSRGPYDLNEFGLIHRILRETFISKDINGPPLSTGIPPVSFLDNRFGSQNEDIPFLTYSDSQKLRFVGDVLLPEAIIYLIMESDNLSYEDADEKILNGYPDVAWVDRITALRSSFQIGNESLAEKA